MIENLKPYPDYKPAGLPWLSQVPKHWQVHRAKNLLLPVDVRSATGDEELLTVSSERGIVPRRTATVTMFQAESYVGHKLCWPGDLVINSLWAWGRGLGVSSHHGIVSSAYGVYRTRSAGQIAPGYLHELVRSSLFNWELTTRSKGVWISRLQLTDESFLNAPLLVPPSEEQSAIVRFLDHADRRIRRYIRTKQQLIKLLAEQRHAIIHRAVTRGVDPDVQLRAVDANWISDIPSHWEIRRIRALAQFVTSGSRGWADFYADDGPIFLRIGNISTSAVDLKLDSIQRVQPPAGAEGERTKVRANDVLLSITALIGAVGIVPEGLGDAYVNQHTALIRLRSGSSYPRWVAYCLLSELGKAQCRILTNGGTKEGLGLLDVKDLCVLAPPLEEQKAIVAKLDEELSGLEMIRQSVQKELILAQEYRTRLIADVVTGKLDAREAAASLPDVMTEAEEAESVDESELPCDDGLDAPEADAMQLEGAAP